MTSSFLWSWLWEITFICIPDNMHVSALLRSIQFHLNRFNKLNADCKTHSDTLKKIQGAIENPDTLDASAFPRWLIDTELVAPGEAVTAAEVHRRVTIELEAGTLPTVWAALQVSIVTVDFLVAVLTGELEKAKSAHDRVTGFEREQIDLVTMSDDNSVTNVFIQRDGEDGENDEYISSENNETQMALRVCGCIQKNHNFRQQCLDGASQLQLHEWCNRLPCARQGCMRLGRLKCSGCSRVGYCSPECQRLAWRAGHKSSCATRR
jgi:hypothetical protein